MEYLGHALSAEGITQGSKVKTVMKMPPPVDVSSLKSFLGLIQFYGKFVLNLATMVEPRYCLTKSNSGSGEIKNEQHLNCWKTYYTQIKSLYILTIACNTSNIGIGAVLFHCYPNGSEHPMTNMSKIHMSAERNYSQIHKEALAIIFGLW